MLANLSSYPWCCFGDFNGSMHMHEKHRGSNQNLNIVVDFREAVQTCNLVDIWYKGSSFTWSNRRYGPHFIEERLDRFLYSKNWRSKFHDTTTTNLANWVSDHCPIILEVKERGAGSKYVSRSFSRDHYEDMWSSYKICNSIVKDEWKSYCIKGWENPVHASRGQQKVL